MKNLSKIISFAANTFAAGLLLLCLLFWLPGLFGIKSFVVLSGSMEPALPTAGVVFVDCRDQNISEGDIVTYEQKVGEKHFYVTHRAVKVSEDYILTKGDANENSDGPIKKSQVTGKVIGHLPWLGYLFQALTGKKKWILFFILLLSQSINFRKDKSI